MSNKDAQDVYDANANQFVDDAAVEEDDVASAIVTGVSKGKKDGAIDLVKSLSIKTLYYGGKAVIKNGVAAYMLKEKLSDCKRRYSPLSAEIQQLVATCG